MAKATPLEMQTEPGSAKDIRQKVEQQLRDRVESWTRFNFADLELQGLDSGITTARATGELDVSITSSNDFGMVGRTGVGHPCNSEPDFASFASQEIQRLRAQLPEVIARWDAANAAALVPVFNDHDALAGARSAYHVTNCTPCRSSGQVMCTTCHGQGRTNCYSCNYGKTTCHGCQGRGTKTVTCSACNGSGSRYEYVTHQAWDSVRNQYVTDTRSELVTCSACHGSPTRSEACYPCAGSGNVTCGSCGGTMFLSCLPCSGAGYVICQPCRGTGHFHDQFTPVANVKLRWTRTPDSEDDDDAQVLAIVGDRFVEFTRSWRTLPSRLRDSSATISRVFEIPFAKMRVGLNDDFRTTWAIGPDYSLESMEGLGDLLLDNDAAELEAIGGRSVEPADKELLQKIFRSEVHGLAAHLLAASRRTTNGSEESAVAALSIETRAFLSPVHIERILSATKNFVSTRTKVGMVGVMVCGLLACVVGVVVLAALSKWHPIRLQAWIPMFLSCAGLVIGWLRMRFYSALSVAYLPGKVLFNLDEGVARRKPWKWVFAALLLASLWLGFQIQRMVGGFQNF